MTERQPRSKPLPPHAPKAEQAVGSDSEPSFDPYKFSTVTVPPDLRRQLLHARLARLEPEFFQDTLPPNQNLEAPPDSPKLEAFVEPPLRRRWLMVVVAGAMLCALLLLSFALLLPAPSGLEVARTSAVAPEGSPNAPNAPTEPTAAAVRAAPARSETAISATAAPIRPAPPAPPAPPEPPAKARAESRVVARFQAAKPAPVEQSKAPPAPTATPPADTVPSPPSVPTPVQTPWFNPK